MTPTIKLKLIDAQAITETITLDPVIQDLHRFRELNVTWDISSAERDDDDETYDLYITTSDGTSSWDLIHFPQVATTGAKRYTAKILGDLLPQTVASNGTANNEGILDTLNTNAVGTLSAGDVRHGKWGDRIGYKLVVAGTVTTGIKSSVIVEGR